MASQGLSRPFSGVFRKLASSMEKTEEPKGNSIPVAGFLAGTDTACPARSMERRSVSQRSPVGRPSFRKGVAEVRIVQADLFRLLHRT